VINRIAMIYLESQPVYDVADPMKILVLIA